MPPAIIEIENSLRSAIRPYIGALAFSNLCMAPCRGRYFLIPIRKYPKNRLRGGALSEVYPTADLVVPVFPDLKAPSPDNPSRR